MPDERRVVVTGAGGFIGAHVVARLLARFEPAEVVCLVRRPEQAPPLAERGVEVHVGDLRDPLTCQALCRRAAVVFHLAARVRFGVQGKAAVDFERDNVDGTVNLIEACPGSVERFVFMSSINAVERAPGDPCERPIDEQTPCHPSTAYGISKRRGELAVMARVPARGMAYVILRPPSVVYGPGCNVGSGMASLIRSVVEPAPLLSFDFPGQFSVIHVDDLARAAVDVGLEQEIRNEIFVVCDEPTRTVSEIRREVARQRGVPLHVRRLPRFAYQAVDRFIRLTSRVPGIGQRVPFQLLMLLHDHAAMTSEKARRVAGFRATVSLADGLRDTIPWVLGAPAAPSTSPEIGARQVGRREQHSRDVAG